MKATKISIVVVLALTLILGLAAYSGARPFGGGMGGGMDCGMGRGMGHGMMGAMNLTPEQAGKLFDAKEKFRNDTAQVRKQMLIKRVELRGLWKAENPDEKAIVAKQKELNTLQGQMIEKKVALRLEARKIAPELAQRFGHGKGQGMGAGVCPASGPCVAPAPAAPAK